MAQHRSQKSHQNRVLIALGANLESSFGSPKATIEAAIARIQTLGVENPKVSHFYKTPCFPADSGPDYVNSAISGEFSGDIAALLQEFHKIEADFGRERVQRWGSRVIDIDLIGFGDQILPNKVIFAQWRDLNFDRQLQESPDQLILPHPRLHERGFVLVPLADVASDWVHPVLGKTVQTMLQDLNPKDLTEITRL